jgi:hypothetical protein
MKRLPHRVTRKQLVELWNNMSDLAISQEEGLVGEAISTIFHQ